MSLSRPSTTTTKTYSSRIPSHSNPTAKRLLELMDRKKTNLCVSVDVTTTKEVLEIVRAVGESVCMVKTHCDIIEDFTLEFAHELVKLSEEMDFIIFEDRKFADIGNTVSLQYSSGLHRISTWSHMTNAHPLPGPGIITGLSSVGKPLGRALLLLAEMSSSGNLAKGEYTREAVRMAKKDREFVVGFIAMHRVEEDLPEGERASGSASSSSSGAASSKKGDGPAGQASGQEGKGEGQAIEEDDDWLILTPGVGLVSKGDSMGQQYRTPRQVILESGCDIIIVGRGIYKALNSGEGAESGVEKVKEEAGRYREEGWRAYEERVGGGR